MQPLLNRTGHFLASASRRTRQGARTSGRSGKKAILLKPCGSHCGVCACHREVSSRGHMHGRRRRHVRTCILSGCCASHTCMYVRTCEKYTPSRRKRPEPLWLSLGFNTVRVSSTKRRLAGSAYAATSRPPPLMSTQAVRGSSTPVCIGSSTLHTLSYHCSR
jgi:hypothetical protein